MEREKLIKDLLYQLRLGEDSRYEFKRVVMKGSAIKGPKQKDLADEMAAFANAKGGFIILGVDDKSHEVTGVPYDQLDNVQGMVTRACQDNIDPPLAIFTRLLELPDKNANQKAIIYIRIDKSLYVHSSGGRYYHRIAESKKEMSPDYLGRLLMQRSQAGMKWFDEQAVPGTTAEDLDVSLAQRYIRDNKQPMASQFRKLKLIVNNDEGDECLSVAGVLMATADMTQWLPNAYVQAVCYSSDRRDADDQLDAQDMTGTLDQQVLQALNFVERNMKVAATKNIGRKDYPQYSLNAVFEALVNAVAHRDYAVYGVKIRLHMFSDKLVIASPGALVNTMEVDDLELRQAPRNHLITSLLARCTVDHPTIERNLMMDKRGEGVPVIMDEAKRMGAPRPEYKIIGEELQLTIFAAGIAT